MEVLCKFWTQFIQSHVCAPYVLYLIGSSYGCVYVIIKSQLILIRKPIVSRFVLRWFNLNTLWCNESQMPMIFDICYPNPNTHTHPSVQPFSDSFVMFIYGCDEKPSICSLDKSFDLKTFIFDNKMRFQYYLCMNSHSFVENLEILLFSKYVKLMVDFLRLCGRRRMNLSENFIKNRATLNGKKCKLMSILYGMQKTPASFFIQTNFSKVDFSVAFSTEKLFHCTNSMLWLALSNKFTIVKNLILALSLPNRLLTNGHFLSKLYLNCITIIAFEDNKINLKVITSRTRQRVSYSCDSIHIIMTYFPGAIRGSFWWIKNSYFNTRRNKVFGFTLKQSSLHSYKLFASSQFFAINQGPNNSIRDICQINKIVNVGWRKWMWLNAHIFLTTADDAASKRK